LRNRILLLLIFCGLITSASAQSNFNRFNFTVGGGLGIGRGEVASFVGNSYHGVAGGGVNFSRMFGVDAEYMYYDLGLRPSVSQSQHLNGATGNMQSVSLDGIVTVPLHSKFGAYGIFGVGFYRRSVSANRELLIPPQACEPVWARWWGIQCVNGALDGTQTLSSYSKDAGGFNFGGGVTYRLSRFYNTKVFIEGRYHRAYHSDGQTSVLPITVGLRW
jgi:Outer membrane protein beta-barrel domain